MARKAAVRPDMPGGKQARARRNGRGGAAKFRHAGKRQGVLPKDVDG